MSCELFTNGAARVKNVLVRFCALKSVGIDAAVINDNLDVNSHENHSSYEIEDVFPMHRKNYLVFQPPPSVTKVKIHLLFGVGVNLNLSCFPTVQ